MSIILSKEKNKVMQKKTKILILRLSSIGDILLSTPFIRQVREAFPKSEIDYVIKKEFYELIQFNPHLDNIYKYDTKTGKDGLKKLAIELNTNNFKYIFDLHNNFRTKYIVTQLHYDFLGKIKKDKIKRALLVYIKINSYKTTKTIPDRYLNTGRAKGITDDKQGLELFWKDHVSRKISKVQYDHKIKNGYIVFGPGAGHFTKRWPMDYFGELLKIISEQRKEKVLLLGSREEYQEFEYLAKHAYVLNFAGKLNLLESAALINGAKVVVSNDSGLMHMATAVKTPVVALFGSTVRELGFFPFRSENVVLENNSLFCRPCSHLGRKRCPLGHFKCMKNTTAQDVFNAMSQYL